MIWRGESQSSLPVIESDREVLHYTAAQDRFNRYGPFPVRASHTETRVRSDSRCVYLYLHATYAKNNWLDLFNLKFAVQIFADHQLRRSQIHESQRLPLRSIRSHNRSSTKIRLSSKINGAVPGDTAFVSDIPTVAHNDPKKRNQIGVLIIRPD
jgi:hypothetical protein